MKYFFLTLYLFVTYSGFTQEKLPVIKATSKKISINDGGFFNKNSWSLSPQTRPDVYTADRSRKAKWVTFYTDIDSIRVKVKPGTRFNFIILLNGKDSCYTQVASAISRESKAESKINRTDTIPFTLTSISAIAVKAIFNDTDTLNLHFDISSFDFHLTKAAISNKTTLLPNQADVLSGKAAPEYNNLNKIASLKMGSMVWKNQEILPTNITAEGMDGRFGWNIFEGKKVEINYDSHLLIISSKLPAALKGYSRSKMEFTNSQPHIAGTFAVAGKNYTGEFAMDTGSDEAIILDSTWIANQNFPKDLKVIKTSVLKDAQGTKYEFKTVLAPKFMINSFQLNDIPTHILARKGPSSTGLNFLGNGVLKRFNMILDFKNDYLYLKPNQLFAIKYKGNS